MSKPLSNKKSRKNHFVNRFCAAFLLFVGRNKNKIESKEFYYHFFAQLCRFNIFFNN